jgi:ABC-type dipeptide/oligopeptide/nickel transport system permease component
MLRYSLRRILVSIPTLLAVLTIIFLVVRVAPGDPAYAALGDYASEDAVERLRERLGLDQPLYVQYFQFLFGLLQGDLGRSLITQQPVSEQIAVVLPYTLQLTFAGIFLGIVMGVPLGVLTAIRRNTWVDYFGRVFSLTGLSFPIFFLAVLLIYLFSVQLGMFPALGAASFSEPLSNLHHLVLPAISLAVIMFAYVTRMTRSAILNVLNDDYIRTARAKGLSERKVLYGHALRSALVPIVSLVGIFTISLLGGSVLVEEVFARPGLGRYMIGAMKQNDYTALQSIMVVYAIIIVIINLITDLIYGLVDPRIRYH